MGSVILVGEQEEAIKSIREIILKHLPAAQILQVDADRVIGALLMERVSLIVYVISTGKEVDLKVISEVKSVTSKAPLLIYGNFEHMQNDLLYVLNKGVHGMLSATSSSSQHIKAIDSLLRGGTYVDDGIKYQAIINLLGKGLKSTSFWQIER